MNRILKIFILIAVAFASSSATAKQTNNTPDTIVWKAKEVFLELPDDVMPTIDKSARFEMVEYYAVDSIYAAKNKLRGTSTIDNLTNDFIKVKISNSSSMSMRLLTGKKQEKIAAVVYTVFGPAADSKIYFLDENMTLLPTEKYFKAPELKEFFYIPKGSITKISELEEMITFPTVEYVIDSENNDLRLRLTVGEHINQDDYNIMKLFLLPEIVYHWENGKFKKVKQKK